MAIFWVLGYNAGMFGIAKPKLPITPEQQRWVESSFLRLATLLGAHRLLQATVVLLTSDHFRDPYERSEVALQCIFARVAMEESLRYYVQNLGFEMTKKWMEEGKLRWCWLEIGDTALMLQELGKQGHDSWKPSCKVGEGVTICFMCEEALAIYRDAVSRGLKASRNPFVGNRLWVVSFSDPDGYRIDFESPTGVPEETAYSPQHH